MLRYQSEQMVNFVAVLVMLGTYTPDVFTNLLRAVAVSIGG